MTPTLPATTPAVPTSSPRYCRHCGYDLRATPPDSPRCPECGRTFNPANPRTFRRHPIRRWFRHIKCAAYALLTLTLLLAAIWLWLFWGWYDEQQALKAIPAWTNSNKPLSPWLREHAGPPGFVLDRAFYVGEGPELGPVDLAPLVRLKQLKWLELRGRALTDLRPLVGRTTLRKLFLWDTGVTDLSPLAELPTLEVVTVPAGVTDLRPLAGLTNLRGLSLVDTRVTELSPLAGLPRLQWIELWGTRVTDLRPLTRLKSLRRVNLPLDSITEEQADELRRALPGCMIDRR